MKLNIRALILVTIIFSWCNISLIKPFKSVSLGLYRFNYTEIPNEIILSKDTLSENIKMNGFNKIVFGKSNKFEDSKQPSCGNDISWNKKGIYYIKNNILTLNYTKGEIHDGIGDSTMKVFKKALVKYKLILIKKDSISLKYISGTTEKIVKNPNFYSVN